MQAELRWKVEVAEYLEKVGVVGLAAKSFNTGDTEAHRGMQRSFASLRMTRCAG
jgi:hypothetical protein